MTSGKRHLGQAASLMETTILAALATIFMATMSIGDVSARQTSLGLDEVEISSLGAVRLSEMFRMMPGMETWSNDRYTQRLIGSGLGGVHSDGPTVLIDGVSYPAFFMDRTLTETLPVSPSDLLSVRWEPGRRIVAGGRVADGLLRLDTKPVDGWATRASIGLINETGDPGPAKLLDSTATNVDRSGPALDARLAWGNGTWTAIAGLQTDLHHLTDDRISGRVRRVYAAPVQPVVTQFSPHIRVFRRSALSSIDIAAGSSRRKDLLFHESAGWEWPVRVSRDWGRIRFDQQLTPAWRTGLDVEGGRISTSNRSAFIELPSPLTLSEGSVEGWVRMGSEARSLTLGAGFRANQFDQNEVSASQSGLFARLTGDLLGSTTSWTTTVLLRQGDDVRADGLPSSDSAPIDWAVTTSINHQDLSGWRIGLELSWMQGRFLENGSFEKLVLMGYDPAEWISAMDAPPTSSQEKEGGFTLTGSLPLGKYVTGWARLDGRWMNGGNLIDRIINQPFGIGPMLPVTSFAADRQGWLFSRSLGLDRASDRGPRVRIYYQFMHVSSMGDDVFFRNVTGFPRHRFVSMISEQREGGLSWTIRAGMTSPWTWPEYIEPAKKRIPVEVLLDATVGKDLAGARLKALVSFLNVPDATLGHHPAGVVEQFAVRLTLRLGLGSQ